MALAMAKIREEEQNSRGDKVFCFVKEGRKGTASDSNGSKIEHLDSAQGRTCPFETQTAREFHTGKSLRY
jgi:hypothetical protein